MSRFNKLKGLTISELTLEGNPLCNRYKNIEALIRQVNFIYHVCDGSNLCRLVQLQMVMCIINVLCLSIMSMAILYSTSHNHVFSIFFMELQY